MSTKTTMMTAVAAGAGALMLAVAPAASAASTSLVGTVCTCGSVTTYNTIRTASGGNFVLDLSDKTGTDLSVGHLATSSNTVFGGATFSSLTSKTTATNVIRGTQFKMRAKMVARSGSDNSWGGGFDY